MVEPIFSEKPIALFDSGVGGLSVFRSIRELLPFENIIYLADNKRVPYGDKPAEKIIEYTREAALFLQGSGIKMLVIACHTSSAHCLGILQKELSIPVIGMIQSSLRSIASHPHCRRLGILGTKGTIGSGIYPSLLSQGSFSIEIVPVAAPALVPFIEKGDLEHIELKAAINDSLREFLKPKVDAVLLACTHYPFIGSLIQKTLGEEVFLIDASKGVALEVKECLERKGLLRKPSLAQYQFYVTNAPETFSALVKLFLSIEINAKLR